MMNKIIRIVPSATFAFNVRCFARFRRAPKNPGIDARLKGFKEEQIDMSYDELEDNLIHEDTQSDFSQLNDSHRQYERETVEHKNFVAHKIVEQKYFQEQLPNFLTWSEKEQIRNLHSQDPEKWSIERIVDSFPVSEDGVKKLLKVQWKPSTQNRISRHDASAMRNWNELKENEMEGVTPSMREHILKFSKRVIPPRSLKDQEETLRLSLGENITGEYSNIIASYQKKIETEYETKMIESKEKSVATKVLDRNKNLSNKREPFYTLDDVKLKIEEKLENSEVVTTRDRQMLTSSKAEIKNDDPQNNYSISETLRDISNEKNDIALYNSMEEVKPVVYLERIVIPKNVWKKGGIYKVDDCYYADDGEFLYRVPGMC